ncbi:hypothetical protein KC331_g8952 [Hortaea werneckii]|uniref:BTB domain-containing protein n=1 Tax=Hortaea werneckii TaxID=91943 RepID=A0A3M7DCM5_HORWE|nr:hypothetical protein KC331_g8952 [Hortaea werneckii]KAI7712239.1 hypothetical protein KC353_g8413 [Hortaea werneckii]RMY61994.1 hypothetical protein D0865_00697 [Hortaea werneckii]
MNISRHPSRWYKDDTSVTIILAEDGTRYTLPKRMACDISDYFEKALEGDSKEAHERTLELPDCTAETFDVLLYFHIYQRLPGNLDSEDQAQLLLLNLWLFGDTYLLPRLKTKAFAAAWEILDHQRAYTEEERAELAEIEGFFKIMADGLAAGKSSRVIANAVAKRHNSDSQPPTNVAPVQTATGSSAAIVRAPMPTSTPIQVGPPALTTPASANARRRARRQANKASKS